MESDLKNSFIVLQLPARSSSGHLYYFSDDYFNDANKTVTNLRLIACKLEEVHFYLESFCAQLLQVTTIAMISMSCLLQS